MMFVPFIASRDENDILVSPLYENAQACVIRQFESDCERRHVAQEI